IFPGVDGGGEWGGPAFDPESGLLYVNSNEMAWILHMTPTSVRSTFEARCASCHGARSNAEAPSLEGAGQRLTREQVMKTVREGTGRMPAFAAALDSASLEGLVNSVTTGRDVSGPTSSSKFFLKYQQTAFDIFLDI